MKDGGIVQKNKEKEICDSERNHADISRLCRNGGGALTNLSHSSLKSPRLGLIMMRGLETPGTPLKLAGPVLLRELVGLLRLLPALTTLGAGLEGRELSAEPLRLLVTNACSDSLIT